MYPRRPPRVRADVEERIEGRLVDELFRGLRPNARRAAR